MMFYIEKNPETLENFFKFLSYSSMSDLISRIIRLDNPNLLDEYNKPAPLFLVKFLQITIIFYILGFKIGNDQNIN